MILLNVGRMILARGVSYFYQRERFSMYYYDNNIIAHHGVLGMKWGVRHDRKSSGSSRSSKKQKVQNRANYLTAKAYAMALNEQANNPKASQQDRLKATKRYLELNKTIDVDSPKKNIRKTRATSLLVGGISTVATGSLVAPVAIVTTTMLSTSVKKRAIKSMSKSYDIAISNIDDKLKEAANEK